MDVEDFIDAIASRLTNVFSRRNQPRPFGGLFDSNWHRSFILSVADHVRAKRPLSTNQSQSVLKIISKARPHLIDYRIATEAQIAEILDHPTHRQPPYESNNVPREVRYIGDNLLAFRYKANPIITNEIKNLGNPVEPMRISNLIRIRPRFDWTHKIWIVPVFRFNLVAIRQLLFEHRFRVDSLAFDYLADCHDKLDQPSNFTFPEVGSDETMLLVNVADDYILAGWVTDLAGGIVL